MLQAIALFSGMFGAWLLLEQRFTPAALVVALAAAIACVVLTARLPRLGRRTFTLMPKLAAVQFMRTGAAFSDAIRTVRAAIAADVRLRPALVRVRTRGGDALSVATLANWIGATPGAVVISIDSDGLLVHVNDESDERFARIRDWEALLTHKRSGELPYDRA
ncbi:MAG: Na+/H+ antiporter subunit E [Vitreimonas sp.]